MRMRTRRMKRRAWSRERRRMMRKKKAKIQTRTPIYLTGRRRLLPYRSCEARKEVRTTRQKPRCCPNSGGMEVVEVAEEEGREERLADVEGAEGGTARARRAK